MIFHLAVKNINTAFLTPAIIYANPLLFCWKFNGKKGRNLSNNYTKCLARY